ncbi:MAG: cytochrome o ubiquinol oxidase subunit IV [Neisseriaceae bacterium]|jgi:cytochrome o ubiquinol oxidase operon protein cyoD
MSNLHADKTGSGHGSTKSYIIGFVLSIILTLIPYYLVVNHTLGVEITHIIILTFAILQLLVQVVFFLHLNSESGPKWNLLAFIFTLVVLVILVFGSIWIMNNLDYNMMDH